MRKTEILVSVHCNVSSTCSNSLFQQRLLTLTARVEKPQHSAISFPEAALDQEQKATRCYSKLLQRKSEPGCGPSRTQDDYRLRAAVSLIYPREIREQSETMQVKSCCTITTARLARIPCPRGFKHRGNLHRDCPRFVTEASFSK